MELLCKGRMSHQELGRLYKGRIGDNSIFCTDSHKSYVQFTKDFSLEHKRIKRGKHKEEIYCNAAHTYTKITNLKEREPIFI